LTSRQSLPLLKEDAAASGGAEQEDRMAERLIGAARKAALHELRDWAEVADRDAIRKSFHFGSFSEAWGFLSQVALLAEKRSHYPELFNDTDRVEIILTTTEVEGLTDRDVAFAHAVDELAPLRDRRR
jgi:4a-hydroxytetrahydrobiopterin dehydratase